jgi:hypothetical protein
VLQQRTPRRRLHLRWVDRALFIWLFPRGFAQHHCAVPTPSSVLDLGPVPRPFKRSSHLPVPGSLVLTTASASAASMAAKS